MATAYDYLDYNDYVKKCTYDIYETQTIKTKEPVLNDDGTQAKDESGNLLYKEVEKQVEVNTGKKAVYKHYITYTANYRVSVNLSVVKSHSFKGGSIKNTEFETQRTNTIFRGFPNTQKDYTTWNSERSNSKRRRRKYEEKIRYYCDIDNKYQLGLTAEEIRSAAYDYADKTMGSAKWYETGSGILSVVMVIVAIVVTIFQPQLGVVGLSKALAAVTGLSASAALITTQAIVIATTIAAFAGSQYYQHTANKAAGEAMSANRYKAADAALKNQRKVEEERAQLTALMIYGGYEIYANGSIYKKGAAGSQTFNSQIAFDANKGILGQLKNDEFGEQLQGRYGGKMAGGDFFHQNLMQVDFPLQKFSYTKDQKLDMLEKRLKRNCVRVATGFTQLFEGYFNADEQGESKYNRIYKLHTDPIKSNMKSIAFLDTLRCYSRDEMQTYDYINQATFRERKENTDPVWIYFNDETFKAFMDNEEIGSYLKHGYSEDEAKKLLLVKKVRMYLQQLGIIFNALEDMADDGIKGKLIRTFFSGSPQTGWNGDQQYTYHTRTNLPFSLSQKKGSDYTLTNQNGDDYLTEIVATSEPVSFLGKNYFTYGYNSSLNAELAISEFDLFGGFYKEDFDRNNFTGEDMLKIYDEFLTRIMKASGKYFFLINEIKTFNYTYTIQKGDDEVEEKTATETSDFFAIEMSEKAYNTLATRLYIPEKLKEDFEKWDWASEKGFL